MNRRNMSRSHESGRNRMSKEYRRTLEAIDPSEKGCAKPYLLTYACGIRFTLEDDKNAVQNWIETYNDACNKLLRTLKPLIDDPKYELLWSVVLMPETVSETVKATSAWKDLKGDADAKATVFGDPANKDAKTYKWEVLRKNAAYHLFLVISDPKDESLASSRPARVLRLILAKHRIPTPEDLTPESLQAAYDKLLYQSQRTAVADAVSAVLRSLISNRNNTQEAERRRQETREHALNAHPEFFKPFDEYCQDQRSWNRACGHYAKLRQEELAKLRNNNTHTEARAILAACQRTAMHSDEAAHMISWRRLKPLTDSDLQTSKQYPELTRRFRQEIPTADSVNPAEEDVFRRFARAHTAPYELCRDVAHVRRMLRLYNDATSVFTSEQAIHDYVEAATPRFPGPAIHLGWQRICNEALGRKPRARPKSPNNKTGQKAGQNTRGQPVASTQVAAPPGTGYPTRQQIKELYNFVTKDVREFMAASRQGKVPQIQTGPDEQAGFWPALETDRYEILEAQEGDGNRVRVKIRIPKDSSGGQAETEPRQWQSILATIRGHTPIPKSQELGEPFSVKNGLSQFIPDRVFTFQRDTNQEQGKTYFKMQRMVFQMVEGQIAIKWNASHMTEVVRDPAVTKQFPENIRCGERLGVLHLLPGGSMLASLTIFEKTNTQEKCGWKIIPFVETIADTRRESYNCIHAIRMDQPCQECGRTTSGNYQTPVAARKASQTKVHIHTHRNIQRLHIEFDDMPYALKAKNIEERKKAKTKGKRSAENEQTIREAGESKTNLGKTHYREVASRIAKVLANNRTGYLLVAGGGRLAVERTVPHPVKKLLSISRSTGRLILSGFLDNTCKRHGITTMVTTARAAKVWAKPAVLHGDFNECRIVEAPRSAKAEQVTQPDSQHEEIPRQTHKPVAETTLREQAASAQPSAQDKRKDLKNRKLIGPTPNDAKGQTPYFLNAAWAILLDHQIPAFRRHVDRLFEEQKSEGAEAVDR